MPPISRSPAARRIRLSLPFPSAAPPRLAALCLAVASLAHAQAPADGAAPAQPALQFNGFGTVAAVTVDSADDWGFRREVTQPSRRDRPVRFDPDSRLGLQADWRPSAQWELVGQLVLKPRPTDQSNQEAITQAFVAFRPTADWTLRAGRTSPDLFLLADSRNVGFSYPWIRPSVEFYGWMPATIVDGVDATHQGSFGDSRWRAKLFGGRSTVTFSDTRNDGDRARVDAFLGGTLTVDAGDWTVKATVASAKSRPFNFGDIVQGRRVLDQRAAIPVPVVAEQAAELRDSYPDGLLMTRYAALGATWDVDPWQLQAEVSRIGGNFRTSRAWYGYASASRRLGESTTLFAMVGRARASQAPLPEPQWTAALTPVVGPAAAAGAQLVGESIADSYNLGRVDQRSLSFGLRYDLGAQAALKAQVDDVRSAAYGGGLWAMNSPAAHHAVVYSLGVDFVF